jgi:hypothetical protein
LVAERPNNDGENEAAKMAPPKAKARPNPHDLEINIFEYDDMYFYKSSSL